MRDNRLRALALMTYSSHQQQQKQTHGQNNRTSSSRDKEGRRGIGGEEIGQRQLKLGQTVAWPTSRHASSHHHHRHRRPFPLPLLRIFMHPQ